MTEEKIFSNLRITDADLLEKIDQYMKDHPDSVVPVDEAQIARITELIKDVKLDEETKPDPREEIPHREQQIQWYEDWLHHLRTGEPMREYEFRSVNEDGDAASEWKLLSNRHPSWAKTHEYRRKPRTVKYWHCAVMFDGLKSEVITGYCKDEVSDQNKRCKEAYPDAKFSPIIETTVEVED